MIKNTFIKEQCELNDIELNKWYILTSSSFYKEDYRIKEAKRELIRSYKNNCNISYAILENNTHPSGTPYVIRNDNSCMPVLFLCRHTLELALKYYLEYKNNIFIVGHDLQELYKSTNLNDLQLEEVINAFSYLDNKTGTMLRYSIDKNNIEYRKKPLFVDVKSICTITNDFIEKTLKNI